MKREIIPTHQFVKHGLSTDWLYVCHDCWESFWLWYRSPPIKFPRGED